MAKKTTQVEVILKALKGRKTGLTDRELAEKTGLVHAATIRSKLTKLGTVVAVGTKLDKTTNRTVRTYGIGA